MKTFLCVPRLLLVAVLGSLAFVGGSLAASGSVSWFSPPRAEPNGWYWMYDDAEPGPPFSDPPVSGLPSFRDITADGSKLAPYNDQPFKYTLPDSFWYYGSWYTPGDKLYISPDGWVSFDPNAASGYPYPPTASPPFPVTDAPNAIMAALWQDMDPTQTPVPSDDNRVYYMHDAMQKQLYVQWYNTQGNANTHIYNFELALTLGGQIKLISAGACGVVFSYHFIHFFYQSSSNGWTADGGKTGIENPMGTMGITYGGLLVNGRVIRAGYKRVFKHDVQAYVFLSPGGTVLRWTEIQPIVVVRNIGEEVEHFPVSVDIYDEDDSLVYAHTVSGFSLMPGEYDTMVCPCWTPGELYPSPDTHSYRKVAYSMLASDECSHNDTLIVRSTVGCDGVLSYYWNFADAYGWIGAYQCRLGTTYPMEGGALVTGGRIWLYACPEANYTYSRLEVWEADKGCGGVADGSYPVAWKNCDTRIEHDWNEVVFDRPVWVSTGTPGNLWAAHTSADYGNWAGLLQQLGLYVWTDPMACYLGPGPGRSGTWLGPDHGPSSDFKWGAYYGDYYTWPIELYTHLDFSPLPEPPCYYDDPHDLTCYRMEPSGEYVEADVPITPELAIANIGLQAEPDAEFFDVKFIVVDEQTSDTVFNETSLMSGPFNQGDTTYGTTPPWTPEGLCDDTLPFVYYELIGIVRLGEVGPDLSDHCPYNDTIRRNVTCLWSHDVGVIDMTWPEPPDEPPDWYGPGSEITVTATVENFGFHAEHDVHVRLEIRDLDDNNVELWHALKNIKFLDWRGNESGNPYTVDVTFPTYTVLNEHRFYMLCCTELEDDCPHDDCEVRYPPGIVEEAEAFPGCFTLEIRGWTISDGCQVRFAVPHQSLVKLDVFDASGCWINSLENDIFEPGYHLARWNGCDAAGRKVAAGIYLVRMEADGFKAVRKLVIIN